MLLVIAVGCSERTVQEVTDDPSLRTAKLVAELRIDGWAESLVPIQDLAVGLDGTIAFTQSQDAQIRFYAQSGELLGVLGRRGQGPGEFLNPFRLGWFADTLWVYDGRQRRISFVAPERSVARMIKSIPFGASPRPEDAGRLPEFPATNLRSIAPDGRFLVSMSFAVNQRAPEPYSGRTTIGRVDENGFIQQIVAILPKSEGDNLTSPGGAAASMPFGSSPAMAVSPHGDRVAIAMASFDGPEAGTFQLTVVSTTGDTVLSRRYGFGLERIPASIADSAREAMIERLRQSAPSLVVAARNASIPAYYPPLRGLLIGMDGTLWVEMRQTPEGTPFLAVEPDGDVIGALILPNRDQIAVAVRERIWVIERDSVDV